MVPKALNPRNDVDRLYVTRKEGRREFASFEDGVDSSIQIQYTYLPTPPPRQVMTQGQILNGV